MGFVLADRRDRALLVTGADNGIRTCTREAWRARTFPNADAARDWAMQHLLAVEFEAVVMLNARPLLNKNGAWPGSQRAAKFASGGYPDACESIPETDRP